MPFHTRSKFDSVLSFFTFWLSLLLILAGVALLAVGIGWLVQVPFGHSTSSQYFQALDFYRQNPEQTEAGHWLVETYRRIRS